MSVIHGNESSFEQLIAGETVLVDFYATWCGPCKMLGPVLEEMAEERNIISIVKIDVDECPSLAQRYGIMSVPSLLLFKNGQLVDSQTGFMPKELIQEWIEKH